ncbi:hypothetical protein BKA25_002163 [Actinoalloteichus hymeniacidonis]|nr:hypothetical protein [Actinoalloteichus hymeniacidonis]
MTGRTITTLRLVGGVRRLPAARVRPYLLAELRSRR